MSEKKYRPFTEVAKQKYSEADTFIAESPLLREFKERIEKRIDNGENYSLIIGDYGQGKSRLLYYLVQKYKEDETKLLSLVSIKNIKASCKAGEFDFPTILNAVIEDGLKDANKDIKEIKNKIKSQILKKDDIEKYKKQIEERIKELPKLGKTEEFDLNIKLLIERKKELEQKSTLETQEFSERFLPTFLTEIKKKGINNFYILFDEVEHLRKEVYSEILEKFLSVREFVGSGLCLFLACAQGVWDRIAQDYGELGSVFGREEGHTIPPVYYEDLKKIVEDELKGEKNPFDDTTIRNIANYKEKVRDMIGVCGQSYNDFKKNPNIIFRNNFVENYFEELVKIESVEAVINDTLKMLRNLGEYNLAHKERLLYTFKLLTFNESIQKDKLIQHFKSFIPHSANKIFSYWAEDNQVIKKTSEDGEKYGLNLETYRKQFYINPQITQFFNILFEKRDKNQEIDMAVAEKLFDKNKNKRNWDGDFDYYISLLYSDGKIAKYPDKLKILSSTPETTESKLPSYIKDNVPKKKTQETWLEFMKILIEDILKKQIRIQENDSISITESVKIYSSVFDKDFSIHFFVPEEEINMSSLRTRLEKLLNIKGLVYIVWPYDNIKFVDDSSKIGQAQHDEESFCKIEKVKSGILDEKLRENCRMLFLFPKKNLLGHKFSFGDYILCFKKYLKGSTTESEQIEGINKSVQQSLNSITTNLESVTSIDGILGNQLKGLLPIKSPFLRTNLTSQNEEAKEILTKLIRNKKVLREEYDKKLFNSLLSNLSFLKGNPSKMAFQDESKTFAGKEIPHDLYTIINCISEDDLEGVDIIFKKLFEKISEDKDFNFNTSNLSGSSPAHWYNTLRTLLLGVYEVFKEQISFEDNKFRRLVGEGLSPGEIEQFNNIVYPLCKEIEKYSALFEGFDLPKLRLIKREVEELEKNVISKLKGIKEKEERTKLLTKKTSSVFSTKSIDNFARVKSVIQSITKISTNYKQETLVKLPTKKYVSRPYKQIMEEGEESIYLLPKVSEIIKILFSKINKKKNIINFEIKEEFITSLFERQEQYSSLSHDEKNAYDNLEKLKTKIGEVKNYSEIKINEESSNKEVFEVLTKLNNPSKELETLKEISELKTKINISIEVLEYGFKGVLQGISESIKQRYHKLNGNYNNIRDLGFSAKLKKIPLDQVNYKIDKASELLTNLDVKTLNKDEIADKLFKPILLYLRLRSHHKILIKEAKQAVDDDVLDIFNEFKKEANALNNFFEKRKEKSKKSLKINFDVEYEKINKEYVQSYKDNILFQGNVDDYEDLKKGLKKELNTKKEAIRNQVSAGLLKEDKKIFLEAQKASEDGNIFRFIKEKSKDKKKFKDILNMLVDMETVGLLK